MRFRNSFKGDKLLVISLSTLYLIRDAEEFTERVHEEKATGEGGEGSKWRRTQQRRRGGWENVTQRNRKIRRHSDTPLYAGRVW